MMTAIVYFIYGFRYGFKNDNGQLIQGISIHFISGTSNTNSENQIGNSVEKMSLPIEEWDDLKALNLKTFDQIKLTIQGFGRSARLVKVEKAENDD